MSKEGRPIERIDAKSAIRKNAELASDWAYHEEAMILYNLAVRFRDELIDPLEHLNRSRMSDPVISFDDARNKEVLATYTVGRNAVGLKDEITFNTAHYKDNEYGKKEWIYGRWSQLETLAHEQVHLYLHHLTDMDGKYRPAHGVEFVQKCESIGLHVLPARGSHYQVADADSPFGRIMKSLGVERPADVPRSDGDKRDWFRPKKERGKSTLKKYTCPSCGLNVRIGVKEDPGIIHHKCSVEKGKNVFFVKFDGREHTIYESASKGKKSKASVPTVIDEINEHHKINAPEDLKEFTVEGIAKKAGISEKTLQEWLESDVEFTTALKRLKEAQKNDPFKTGTDEDTFVNSMMLALLLLETKDRHYISQRE